MIDICIVNYFTDELVKLNIDWLKRADINFIIGENSPYKYKNGEIFVSGVSRDKALATTKNGIRVSLGQPKGGNHHSMCMELCIKRSQARFILMLDADYYSLMHPADFIQYMKDNEIAVLGTAYKSSIPVYLNNMRGQSAYYPMTHFCIIDRDLYKEEIILDPRRTTDKYIHWDDIVDTGLPFRQTLHKYKIETFNLCVSSECSMCKELGQHLIESLPNNKNKPVERSFFNNVLCGMHYHYRGSSLDRIKLALKKEPTTLYHGQDLFYSINDSKKINYWND